MNRFKIPAARKKQISRIAVAILKEPKAVMAFGALVLAIGVYTAVRAEPLPILMVIGGGVGVGVGITQYKMLRRRGGKVRRKADIKKRNRLYILIACAPAIAAFGFFKMWSDIPVQTFVALFGALILAIGFMQLKIRRSASNAARNS